MKNIEYLNHEIQVKYIYIYIYILSFNIPVNTLLHNTEAKPANGVKEMTAICSEHNIEMHKCIICAQFGKFNFHGTWHIAKIVR